MFFSKLLFMILILFGASTALGKGPGVKVGEKVPVLELTTISGKTIDLSDKNKFYILVFYRGSWCPYCMKQLKSIEKEVIPKLSKESVLIAISVDKKITAKKMKDKYQFSFGIVSDPKAGTLKSFKIANKLKDDLVKKYKASYQIDIEKDSGESHHLVAHPGVFIIKNSKIVYSDVHINYKDRTKNREILSVITESL